MKVDFWLKVKARKVHNRHWRESCVEVRKSKPSTSSNEIAVKISLEIPDEYFEVPEIQASIKVPTTNQRPFITSDVENRIGEELTKQLGLKVHISSDSEGEQ